jgi:hypothetical protein
MENQSTKSGHQRAGQVIFSCPLVPCPLKWTRPEWGTYIKATAAFTKNAQSAEWWMCGIVDEHDSAAAALVGESARQNQNQKLRIKIANT